MVRNLSCPVTLEIHNMFATMRACYFGTAYTHSEVADSHFHKYLYGGIRKWWVEEQTGNDRDDDDMFTLLQVNPEIRDKLEKMREVVKTVVGWQRSRLRRKGFAPRLIVGGSIIAL